MTDPDQVWGALSHDPRVAEHAGMRASDADRDVVLEVLTEAYADGRLDREELDARSAATHTARTLGELLPPLDGLVSTRRPADRGGVLPAAQLEERAVEAWRKERREALWGLLSVSAIVWTVWAFTSGFGSFPWPVCVTLAALLNLGRIQVQRAELVRDHRRRLERRQRRELERREHPEDEQ